jgi:hypothetical protein
MMPAYRFDWSFSELKIEAEVVADGMRSFRQVLDIEAEYIEARLGM